MVTFYENGKDFLAENKDFLDTSEYKAIFFYIDAPLSETTDRRNYAVKVSSGSDRLLALKMSPYSLLLFGDSSCVPELLCSIIGRGCEIGSFMGDEDVCNAAVQYMHDRCLDGYYESMALDFMEALTVTSPSSDEISLPCRDDAPELAECLGCFVKECNLPDDAGIDTVLDNLSSFRFIRHEGRIVSMLRICASTDSSRRIAYVYTRPEYRGRGFARKTVNAAKNEILAFGFKATLNVDRHNRITNHLYRSLGFVKLFSHGEYRHTVEVVAALIRSGDRFMICRRPANKKRGLLWEYVGGKVEPGESKEAALIRECREELDITVAPGSVFTDVLFEYPDMPVHLTLFNAVISEGTPKLLEHADLKWIRPSEIPDFDFCPADKEINEKIMTDF